MANRRRCTTSPTPWPATSRWRSRPTGPGCRRRSRRTGPAVHAPCSTAAPKGCSPACGRTCAGSRACWRCSTTRTRGNCTWTAEGCCSCRRSSARVRRWRWSTRRCRRCWSTRWTGSPA
ncbi:hypothetical protein V2I01_19910 [Micromonospora sp. BRA006-A]|nr:hypothetical protein [Micromonospora sp. BRA006-A]